MAQKGGGARAAVEGETYRDREEGNGERVSVGECRKEVCQRGVFGKEEGGALKR